MRARTPSLRVRLTAIILAPTMAIALLAGLWQLGNARATAEDVFDRSLLSAALAVERDVAMSGGDALSVATRDLLADTSGGKVFYHVYAPDGVIVAGYATPPVGVPRDAGPPGRPQFFDARYMGRSVRGVRLRRVGEIDGMAGVFTTTVWQDSAVRQTFSAQLVARSAVVIGGLLAALAGAVWFGVGTGLRPLTDLEDAIRRRSRTDLSPIRRPVPVEVRGIVATLNRLFAELSRKMEAQRVFIANAAHQLRNPIAGVLALAEAAGRAPDARAQHRRVAELQDAVGELSRLAERLLALERAEDLSPPGVRERFDLGAALRVWVAEMAAQAPPGVAVVEGRIEGCVLEGDRTLIREAVRNLLDNAFRHGGPRLRNVEVSLVRTADGGCRLGVRDDGQGLSAAELAVARERFFSGAASAGSGLGLAIVDATMHACGGTLVLEDARPGLRAVLEFPVAGNSAQGFVSGAPRRGAG